MFQPKDRVLVKGAGNVTLPATVLMLFCSDYRKPETAYAVLVHVDGDALGSSEAHKLPDVQPFVAHDTRCADEIALAEYYPAECFVCGAPVLSGSQYCSEAHRKIQEGEPDAREIAANL